MDTMKDPLANVLLRVQEVAKIVPHIDNIRYISEEKAEHFGTYYTEEQRFFLEVIPMVGSPEDYDSALQIRYRIPGKKPEIVKYDSFQQFFNRMKAQETPLWRTINER